MKRTLYQFIVFCLLTISLGTLTSVAEAQPYYPHCGWIAAHWANGSWHPAHHVCWGRDGQPYSGYGWGNGQYACHWVAGFWAYGYWHPAHRVCWYR